MAALQELLSRKARGIFVAGAALQGGDAFALSLYSAFMIKGVDFPWRN